MPLDALGRTRATMPDAAGVFPTPRGAGNPLKVLCRLCISLNVVVCVCVRACLCPLLVLMLGMMEAGRARARALPHGVLGPGACNSFPQTRNA